MTARHSAAVARYAKAMAEAVGCSKADQELVHTAGLLHDIGKFIFPDRILLANTKLTDEDWEIVKKHPAQGAKLVRRLDGYGAVADIILAHHERIDGNGYPNGLVGDAIPLLSRMISIADTYDVMTARDSYRDPVSRAEAIAELRRVSGKQLDGQLVEIFIGLLAERELSFQHTTDSDFERRARLRAAGAGFCPAAHRRVNKTTYARTKIRGFGPRFALSGRDWTGIPTFGDLDAGPMCGYGHQVGRGAATPSPTWSGQYGALGAHRSKGVHHGLEGLVSVGRRGRLPGGALGR